MKPRLNNTYSPHLLIMSTLKQREYLDILLNDCGFIGPYRRDMIKVRFNVNFTDELTQGQASQLITELKEIKENK